MRYRYTVSLYSDSPIEAEIADYLSAMPRSRRQEAIRMLIKLGFSSISGESTKTRQAGDLPKPIKDNSEPVTQKDEKKTFNEDRRNGGKKLVKKDTNSPHSERKPIEEKPKTKQEEVKQRNSSQFDNQTEIKNGEHVQIDDKDSIGAESDIDPLSKINALFDGINSE